MVRVAVLGGRAIRAMGVRFDGVLGAGNTRYYCNGAVRSRSIIILLAWRDLLIDKTRLRPWQTSDSLDKVYSNSGSPTPNQQGKFSKKYIDVHGSCSCHITLSARPRLDVACLEQRMNPEIEPIARLL